jgi:hypothetical protein
MPEVLSIGVVSGTHTQRVEPGDLITAEFMNAILARLDDIENRLAAIEGGIKPTQPTFTFTPTLTFNPTHTLPTTLMPTFTFFPTFFPTLTQTFSTFPTFSTFFPTLMTPTMIPTGGLNTFIATLMQPTLGENVMNPTRDIGNPTRDFGINPSIGMSFDPSLGMNVAPASFTVLPAGSAIFPEDADAGALPGINKDQRAALGKAGINTVKDVSLAKPEALAEQMKVSVDHATAVIGIAKNVVGGNLGAEINAKPQR